MIWDDPWCSIAATEETTLPPLPPTLSEDIQFRVLDVAVSGQWDQWTQWEQWIAFVHTGWTVAEVKERLRGAFIPVLLDTSGRLLGTCVLRPRTDRWWLLETLRAEQGHGSTIIRAAFYWLWKHTEGQFRIAFLWEMSLAGAAWCLYGRGWWRAMRRIHWGWTWSDPETGCGWCPLTGETAPWKKRHATPVLVSGDGWSAVVSDSGARDSYGWVLASASGSGSVPWNTITKTMGWRRLWCHAASPPPPSSGQWRWSGEVVVVGAMNSHEDPPAEIFTTAEI
jgi:hypothetical protein